MKTASRHRDVADQVRMILGAVGLYLIIFGLVATGWSVHAALGQRRYAELVGETHDPDGELALAREAYYGYSRNYAVCIRAAETAYKAAESATDPETAAGFASQADYWVSRGLDLNPWLMELWYLKACLLERKGDPQAALDAWQEYVDWHFWEPRNLEILAGFQERAGRFAEALQTLEVMKPYSPVEEWRQRLKVKMETAPPGTVIPAAPPAGRP